MHYRIYFLFLLVGLMGLNQVSAQSPDSGLKPAKAISETARLANQLDTQRLSNSASVIVSTDRLAMIISKHGFINSKSEPVSTTQISKRAIKRDLVFYALFLLFLMLGFLRVAFQGYFQNMIRVFFNTSLRQSQLTDQLLQARLPSLLFNALFLISLALFGYVQLVTAGLGSYDDWTSFFVLLGFAMTVYMGKYLVLRFMAWATGIRQPIESYLFLTFLINKFMVVFLLPSILLIVFASNPIQHLVKDVSLYVLILFFLYRYLRAYPIIRPAIRVSRFHFLLIVFCFEIMPVLIISRLGMVIVGKNL
jgi:hypothetical protein